MNNTIKKPEEDDKILAPPPEIVVPAGDPLTVADVYNYCQEYIPCSFKKEPCDLTMNELEEVSIGIQRFIRAWYSIEGCHQTRWENAISICTGRQPNERSH